MKIKQLLGIFLMVSFITACGPSYSSIDEKIQKGDFEEINENEKEQVAMLDYLSEEMNFISNNQGLSEGALLKEEKQKFPYSYGFMRYYGLSWLSDNAKEKWDLFLQDQINKGNDKIYGYNPLYVVMVNHDRDITQREIPLIAEYVNKAKSSSNDGKFPLIKVISNRARMEAQYPNLSKAYYEGLNR
ncbi:MAG: hypothetical protein J1E95_07575 [Muribaculaceae bacterium]|nr:hypothetical protein [Muribaculaceae bacterium]